MTSTTKAPWIRAVVLAVIVVLVLGAVYLGMKKDESTVEVAEPAGPVLEVGDSAPRFTALDKDGLPVDSDALTGRIWLVFNATWCSSCRAEIPEVQELANRSDVEVVAVYLRENTADVRAFADRLGLEYTQVADPNGEISSAYGISSVPSHVLVEDGVVTFKKLGALRADDMNAALD
ncbi:MAG: TlpA disulfide reductase family protein [Actinomycetaceae bacterium]|nr:TlpA disulfide reductase family protein [Actinomycetaceae bacterium]